MKRSTKILILATAVIVIASWIFTFSFLLFKRYPSESEIRTQLAAEIAGRKVTIDTDQGEIGLFGIKIEGEEEYFIEAVEKWVSPWENYYGPSTDHLPL